jgi:predicted RNase H-like nuclease (RuvC/YqgF family)
MNRTIHKLKQGLLQCANENEGIIYLAGQVDISSICKDAKNTIERLEKENQKLKAQIEKMRQDVSDMKYFTSFGTVTNACKELLSKWELAE